MVDYDGETDDETFGVSRRRSSSPEIAPLGKFKAGKVYNFEFHAGPCDVVGGTFDSPPFMITKRTENTISIKVLKDGFWKKSFRIPVYIDFRLNSEIIGTKNIIGKINGEYINVSYNNCREFNHLEIPIMLGEEMSEERRRRLEYEKNKEIEIEYYKETLHNNGPFEFEIGNIYEYKFIGRHNNCCPTYPGEPGIAYFRVSNKTNRCIIIQELIDYDEWSKGKRTKLYIRNDESDLEFNGSEYFKSENGFQFNNGIKIYKQLVMSKKCKIIDELTAVKHWKKTHGYKDED